MFPIRSNVSMHDSQKNDADDWQETQTDDDCDAMYEGT
jgi:hypothetical protein